MKLPALPLPAVPLPGPLAKLVDAEKAALLRARFLAWWEGEDFDPEAFARAQAEAAAAEASPKPPSAKAPADEKDLFDPPRPQEPPRFEALGRIWGQGRVGPGIEEDERLHVARIGAPAGRAIAVIGPGSVTPVRSIARAHPGPITVYEWREEAASVLQAHVKRMETADRITVAPISLDSFAPPSGAFDGVISFDELSYVPSPEAYCRQLARMLSPNGVAALETYCSDGAQDLRTAFLTSFSEPQLSSVEQLIEVMFEAGLRVDSQDDTTEEHLRLVREAFRRLSSTLEGAQALPPLVAREVAWEAEAWRARVTLLSKRQIVRRQFVLSRRPDA